MENENEQTLPTEGDIEDYSDNDLTKDDSEYWKAEALKYQGIAKRKDTQLSKLKTEKVEQQTTPPAKTEVSQTKEFDLSEKTFISQVLGVKLKNAEEMNIVKDYVENGKTLEDLVDNRHFNNDLKDIRETQAVKDALPSTSKRSSTSARDSVDYWVAKYEKDGELPDDREMRQKVVNAKYNQEKQGNPFATQSVVGGPGIVVK